MPEDNDLSLPMNFASPIEQVLARLEGLAPEELACLNLRPELRRTLSKLKSQIDNALSEAKDLRMWDYEPPLPVDPKWPIEVSSFLDALLLAHIALDGRTNRDSENLTRITYILALHIHTYPNPISVQESIDVISLQLGRVVNVNYVRVNRTRLKQAIGEEVFGYSKRGRKILVSPEFVKELLDSKVLTRQRVLKYLIQVYSKMNLPDIHMRCLNQFLLCGRSDELTLKLAERITRAYPKILEIDQRDKSSGLKWSEFAESVVSTFQSQQ